MSQVKRNNFITAETTELHNEVAALYEALMDSEEKEAISLFERLSERLRTLKDDLFPKQTEI